MSQEKSYLERAIQYHSDKVKLYEHVNKNFLYGIIQYHELYKDLFTEKEYATILHFCFNQTSSVKAFFSLLEEQLIEHGAIRMRRKQEEKAQVFKEKDKERAAKFKELEVTKKQEVSSVKSEPIKKVESEPPSDNKWAKRFSDLESKLKEQKVIGSPSQVNKQPENPLKFKAKKKQITFRKPPKLDEKKGQHVEALIRSLYEQGSYSLPRIAKLTGVHVEVVKQVLKL
ncbi:hypothetical protein [Litchfieldia alkalitelluris]|uniref:hypothetical protein n=1 Tax=Litchfieldia alkalitelluris TaxID=304268 RepID=UPI000996E5B3|nr:hypothetical protein [Litchfieldia alkalitelluris]